jgi:hypothetical protein
MSNWRPGRSISRNCHGVNLLTLSCKQAHFVNVYSIYLRIVESSSLQEGVYKFYDIDS